MVLDKLLRQSLIWRGFYFLTNVILNIVLSRVLLAASFGSLFYWVNILSLLTLLLGMSLESAFTYFVSSKKIKAAAAALIGFIWILSIIIPLLVIQYFIFRNKGFLHIAYIQMVVMGILFVSGNLFINYFSALFNAFQNFWLPGILLGIVNLLTVLLIIYCKTDPGQLVVVFFSSFFLQGLFCFISFVLYYKVNLFSSGISLPSVQHIFRFAITAAGANIIFFLLYRIDYWFVEKNCSALALGNYIQASKMGQLCLVIPQILAAAVFPAASSGEDKEVLQQSLIRIMRILLKVFLVLFLLFLFSGTYIFTFIFGTDFTQSNLAFLFLLPGIFCLSVLSILSAYFGGNNRVAINLKGALLGLIIVIIASIICWQFYTIRMAAIISSIGYGANFLYAFLNFRKNDELPLKDLISFRNGDLKWIIHVLFKP
jgi:O-antigen/teichoic acid export membrane protein